MGSNEEELSEEEIKKLKDIARKARILITKMVYIAGSGHIGGGFSSVDILTVLFFKILRHNPKEPFWEERDRVVMSKGHGGVALYAIQSLAGYYSESWLWSFRKIGTPFQGHPSIFENPYIEFSTGSLGHGFSFSAGLAMGLRMKKSPARVFTILGDGEMQEGQVWECLMSINHFRITNLCPILDRNFQQIDGCTEDIMKLEPIAEKIRDFGFDVIEIDGHNFQDIYKALRRFEENMKNDKTTFIIAKTKKGKGVSIFEGNLKYHGAPPTKEEFEIAMKELNAEEEIEKTEKIKKVLQNWIYDPNSLF